MSQEEKIQAYLNHYDNIRSRNIIILIGLLIGYVPALLLIKEYVINFVFVMITIMSVAYLLIVLYGNMKFTQMNYLGYKSLGYYVTYKDDSWGESEKRYQIVINTIFIISPILTFSKYVTKENIDNGDISYNNIDSNIIDRYYKEVYPTYNKKSQNYHTEMRKKEYNG